MLSLFGLALVSNRLARIRLVSSTCMAVKRTTASSCTYLCLGASDGGRQRVERREGAREGSQGLLMGDEIAVKEDWGFCCERERKRGDLLTSRRLEGKNCVRFLIRIFLCLDE